MLATLTSFEPLPAGDGMIPTNAGLLTFCVFQIQIPASGSPPHGLLKVPV